MDAPKEDVCERFRAAARGLDAFKSTVPKEEEFGVEWNEMLSDLQDLMLAIECNPRKKRNKA